jgi:hypothetical protein
LGHWHKKFLAALPKTPSVTLAAKAAGVGRKTVYEHRDRDPEFAAAWDDALNQSLDALEHEVYERAKSGDTQLLMFILRTQRPAKWRDNRMEIDARVCGVLLLPQKEDLPP